MGSYQFKKGLSCSFYGAANVIDNSNLTDSIAEHLIASNKADKKDFIIKNKKTK